MSAFHPDQGADFATRSSVLLAAMANANRLNILTFLQGDEYSVNALSAKVGLSQSALSQHLAKLREADLVSTRRDAQTVFYSSSSPEVAAVLQALRAVIGEGQVKRARAA